MKSSPDLKSNPVSRLLPQWGYDLLAHGLPGMTIFLLVLAVPLSAARVRVPNGTLIRIKLRSDLTTENVQKGSRVELEVADNVVVNNNAVIPKGAVAWGQVTRVKGAGKKKAKDASVTFRIMAVRAADNQDIPLRMLLFKSKKSDPKENEIEERSPIRGSPEMMIGAEKGKEYASYTDADVSINVPETSSATQSSPSPAPPTTSRPTELLPPEQAAVEFQSTPAGADIMIDGGYVGNTPSTLRVAPGRHQIEVRLGGYQAWTRTMVVGPGSHPSIRATLEKE